MNEITVSKSRSWHYRMLREHSRSKCRRWEEEGKTNICVYVKEIAKALLFICLWKFWRVIRYPIFSTLIILAIWCQFVIFYVGLIEMDSDAFANRIESLNAIMPIAFNKGFIYTCNVVGGILIIVEAFVLIFSFLALFKVFVIPIIECWYNRIFRRADSTIIQTSESSTIKLITEWITARTKGLCKTIRLVD